MHCIDKFRQGLRQSQPTGTITFQQSTDFAAWLRDDGISLFKDAFLQETGFAVPTQPDDKLIERAYPKGVNDINRKQEQQAFYSANAQIFTDTCSFIASAVVTAHSDPKAEPFASRHYALLNHLVLDAQVLLADWAALIQQVPGMYGIGKNSLQGAFEISHAADQLMFAGSPFFAFSDNAADASTALLRVALETRLRFGFGLLGVLDKATQAVLPLKLNIVLAAIATHENKMKLGVPFQHIERLYNWSNIYVHVGLKHFTWSPIFANRYLNPFFRGGKYSGGHSIYAGICIGMRTITAVQLEVEKVLKLDPNKYELLKLDPKDCKVVFRT